MTARPIARFRCYRGAATAWRPPVSGCFLFCCSRIGVVVWWCGGGGGRCKELINWNPVTWNPGAWTRSGLAEGMLLYTEDGIHAALTKPPTNANANTTNAAGAGAGVGG